MAGVDSLGVGTGARPWWQGACLKKRRPVSLHNSVHSRLLSHTMVDKLEAPKTSLQILTRRRHFRQKL